MWQHGSEFLCYALWSKNNLVQTLSNFHTPKIIDEGLKRKRKINGVCKIDSAVVPCLHQNINYSETFHLIDKGNDMEAKNHLVGQSKARSYLQLFNMNFNNIYRIHMALMEKSNQGSCPLSMAEGIKKVPRAFLQRGEKVRKRAPDHPPTVRHIACVYDTGYGKRKRTNAKGVTTTTTITQNLSGIGLQR